MTAEIEAANKQLVQAFIFWFVGTMAEVEARCRMILPKIDKENQAACLDILMTSGSVMSTPKPAEPTK